MELQLNTDLKLWATISESPISYMHKNWWSALDIEDLYALYKKDNSLAGGINKFIFKKKSMQPLPYNNVTQKELNDFFLPKEDHKAKQSKINYFWIDNFFNLRSISFLTAFLLLKEPNAFLMNGKVLRQIPSNLSVDKIKILLEALPFIDGGLRKCMSCLPYSIESFGADLLFSVIGSISLKQRIEMLFPPELQIPIRNQVVFCKEHTKIIYFMMKRVHHLYSNLNKEQGI